MADLDVLLQQGDRGDDDTTAVSPPIWQTANFEGAESIIADLRTALE